MPESIEVLWAAVAERLPALAAIAGVAAGGLGFLGFALMRSAARADRNSEVVFTKRVAERRERERLSGRGARRRRRRKQRTESRPR